MPYINEAARRRLEGRRYVDSAPWLLNVGDLTWILFKLAKDYGIETVEEQSYQRHAEVIAALDNAKEEYRRRFLNPYEDKKREANGDV